MLVIINRQEFDSMDDASLIWTCIEPTIRQIRGKSFSVKLEVSTHLNAGQRALLMFQMFYGHSGNGVVELLNHLSYLLSQNGVWSELKSGFRYFGDTAMNNMLDEMKAVYDILKGNNSKAASEWPDISNSSEASELRSVIGRLDSCVHEMIPTTVRLVGTYIRSHPDEFVQIMN